MKDNFRTLISAILAKVSTIYTKKEDLVNYTKKDSVYTKKETNKLIDTKLGEFESDLPNSVLSINGQTPDESGNVEFEVGVTSWNDLEDRPFYATATSYKCIASSKGLNYSANNNTYAHMADIPDESNPRLDGLLVGSKIQIRDASGNDYEHVVTQEDIVEYSNAIFGNAIIVYDRIVVVYSKGALNDYRGIYFLKSGTPVASGAPLYFTLADEEVIKLDEKYIPGTIARVSDITVGVTSWNDLADRPFGDSVSFPVIQLKYTALPQNVGDNLYKVNLPDNPFVDGKTYKIRVNGPFIGDVEVIGKASTASNGVYMTTLVGDRTDMVYAECNIMSKCVYFKTTYDMGSLTVTVYVYEGQEVPIPLDEKYIPNTIARVSDIPEIPTNISQLTNDAGYITAADLPDNPGEDSGGAAIIDVIELPTEDINEQAFYRLLTGTFMFNRVEYNNWTVKCVDELPSEGEPAFSGDPSDVSSVAVTAYYNITDNEVYGYVTDAMAAMFGVPANWYPISVLTAALGFSFEGIIYNIFDDPMDERFRLLLSTELYYYKDSWVSMKPIGRSGTGASSEIFNTVLNVASGMFSHAEGVGTQASGEASHAEGYASYAESDASHAEGYASHAEGDSSNAEGYSSHAEGGFSYAQGDDSHAEGYSSYAQGDYSHAEGYSSYAFGRSQHAQGEYNISDPDVNHNNGWQRSRYAHIVGNGTSDAHRSNAHTLDWDGNATFAGVVTGTGADYAEYFEWSDGNPDNEDRVGLIVTLDGDKIRPATTSDDILGVVSATAMVLGDNAEWEWRQKYLYDDYGRVITEMVEEFRDEIDRETGETKKISTGFHPHRKLNPNYDPEQAYVRRSDRPEWEIIGLIGKLHVTDDGTCAVGGYATVGENGIATASTNKTSMRVMKRIADNVILVLMK